MSPAFSVYLDAFRFLAALVVFVDHATNFVVPNTPLALIAAGREAVVAFFVLSGLVIAFAVDRRETDWRAYAAARVARIYPVAIACLVVTFAADTLGQHIDPEHYRQISQRFGGFVHPLDPWAALRCLTFSNQLWASHVVFGSAEPYWSLGYEVPYYVLFGILCFTSGRLRIGLAVLWALACGPKILSYLPLWLAGVAIWRLVAARRLPGPMLAHTLAWVPIPVALAIWLEAGPFVRDMMVMRGFAIELAGFGYFSALGLCVAAHLVGAAALLDRRPPVDAELARLVHWLAGGSFSLYLVHEPLLAFASTFVRDGSPIAGMIALVAVFWTAYLIAEVAERPKRLYGRIARRLLFAGPPSAPTVIAPARTAR